MAYELLTPDTCALALIDHQPQMAFGVQSIDRQMLKNNVVALAKSAKVFKVPTTITTVETEGFSGHAYPELLAVFRRKMRVGHLHVDAIQGIPGERLDGS